ncbi:hypothetical protein AAHA92_12288 [Salvia divinorum]|uniref:Integrase catalytic domain-containing protein n=1 Tax=Salvia divinorum TaxID=28513 RepID=A0ABD1HN22_SALDI
MGYKFVIEYKRGITNKAADALSHQHESEENQPEGAVLDVSREGQPTAAQDEAREQFFMVAAKPIPDVMRLLRDETATLPELVELVTKIRAGEAPSHLAWADGLIYFNRRVFVSPNSRAKRPLLDEHHSSPLAGHPGHERTFRLLAAGFFWPKMRKDVKNFVEECVVCQSTKYLTRKPAGLLQPLPVPSQVWEDVSMDFITGLPQSRGYTSIMVVVDRLSKYAHFASLPTRFDALRVAQLFVNTVVRHHGFPKTLVSDRDSVFLNATWEEMMRLSGTKLHFSTAYHPQSDGQTEVRNRDLEQYLRAFTADKPSKWANFLPWAELALNCFHHAGLGTSPYRALYGRDPPSLVAAPPPAKTPPNVAEMIRQRGELLVTLRRNLQRAQQKMTDVANRHRRHVEFEVGDLVWLKLQPYRQHSVAKSLSAKLSRRFYGPFEVLERVGPVAYKLRLPKGSRIHNVFHVGLLREFIAGTGDVDGVRLPPEFVEGRPVVRPVGFLDEKVIWREGKPEKQVLVRWEDDEATPTWDPFEAMGQRFPDIHLGDKVILNRGGVDTSTPVTSAIEEERMREQDETEAEVVPEANGAEHSRGTGDAANTRVLRPREKLKQPSKFKS